MALNNPPIGKKSKVAIYVRVSTLHQIDRESLPMQKQDLVTYAKLMLGTDDVVIFEDAGYSGKNTDRPKFQEMMSQMRAGIFTHLLVWKIDRISRNLLDFSMMYKELKDLGVTFISKNEQFDTSTAMGEAMLKIILVFAELERNMTSERVAATMISRASNGQWNGGRVPYGYTWNSEKQMFSFNDNESDIALIIHNKYEELRSLVREARWLNEKGYRTRTGNLWNPVSLQIILRSVFYCGDYQYNRLKEGDRQRPKDKSEWITISNHHPAIVSREQKERIISILEMNCRMCEKRNMYTSAKHTHIFASIMYCGNCGKPMGATIAAAKTDWQYSKYSCSTRMKSTSACNSKSVSDPIIGEFLFNYILNMLNAQNNFSSISNPAELERRLLLGDAFQEIDHIEADGLNDLYNILLSGIVAGEIYGKNINIKKQQDVESELSRLRNEKQRLERALERLTNLYLYSEDAMAESEYIIQKVKLTDALHEIDEQIDFSSSEALQDSISDEAFIQRTGQFIIAQKLNKRNYINYKRLAMSVDAEILQSFVRNIIDSIIMDAGRVKQIIFKNGLSHIFVYKKDNL